MLIHLRPIRYDDTVRRADLDLHGADERNRTLDLLITSELLYQLSYSGIAAAFVALDLVIKARDYR